MVVGSQGDGVVRVVVWGTGEVASSTALLFVVGEQSSDGGGELGIAD